MDMTEEKSLPKWIHPIIVMHMTYHAVHEGFWEYNSSQEWISSGGGFLGLYDGFTHSWVISWLISKREFIDTPFYQKVSEYCYNWYPDMLRIRWKKALNNLKILDETIDTFPPDHFNKIDQTYLPILLRIKNRSNGMLPMVHGFFLYCIGQTFECAGRDDLLGKWYDIAQQTPAILNMMVTPKLKITDLIDLDIPTVLLDIIISYIGFEMKPRDIVMKSLIRIKG